MVALHIGDVPESVRDALAERARARGLSLPDFLESLLREEARRAGNVVVLNRFAGRSDGTSVDPGETAAELAELRGRRNTDLGSDR